MSRYFKNPFPFSQLIKKSRSIPKLNLEESIRAHLRSLILMRKGEFAYNREMGFIIWDFDKEVFYHEREPYYEKKKKERGLLENTSAQKHFKDDLIDILKKNELRLDAARIEFKFEKVDGNLSVYQRKAVIQVSGRIKSTGKMMSPPFRMSILYTPFQVETN